MSKCFKKTISISPIVSAWIWEAIMSCELWPMLMPPQVSYAIFQYLTNRAHQVFIELVDFRWTWSGKGRNPFIAIMFVRDTISKSKIKFELVCILIFQSQTNSTRKKHISKGSWCLVSESKVWVEQEGIIG